LPRIVRRTRLAAVGRRGLLLVVAILLTVWVVALPRAGAQTGAGSVAALEQRLRAAQAASNAAVARFQAATARHGALVDQIAEVERRVEQGRARVAELRRIAQDRAVSAYTNRDQLTDASTAWFGVDDVMLGIRRATLLEHANARDNAAISQLRVLDEDLGIRRPISPRSETPRRRSSRSSIRSVPTSPRRSPTRNARTTSSSRGSRAKRRPARQPSARRSRP
jgi:hypothetical protein